MQWILRSVFPSEENISTDLISKMLLEKTLGSEILALIFKKYISGYQHYSWKLEMQ